MNLIDKDALVAKIDKIKEMYCYGQKTNASFVAEAVINSINNAINTIEVIDPYAQWIQYASIEAGIKAHAEDYSFNIESELFNQLTKKQQALWRKEIEQACISGGYSGLTLAKDPRYKENLEVKEVDLEKEIEMWEDSFKHCPASMGYKETAKHFFELGVNVSHPLTWEDIDLILDITDQIANDDSMEEKLNNMSQEKYCIEVLKQFKAQKGEGV